MKNCSTGDVIIKRINEKKKSLMDKSITLIKNIFKFVKEKK
jgi:hypothetical protein